MAISTSALIPLILMCFLIAGGVIAFAKIATTPEPSMPSAYYMYSSNYETGTDRNTSLVTTPERAHVSPGDVERGMGPGGTPSVRQIREMAYAGQERRMSVQREGSYGNGGYPDRAYDQRGYEQRGYDPRGYDQRGYNGDRPYPGERGISPPQRPAMYPGERAMYPGERAMYHGERAVSPVAAGNTKEMVYDGGEREVVHDGGERGMVHDGGERGMVQTSTPSS